MTTNPFDHMEEAWGLDVNPFPHSAISHGWREPYSDEVFPAEVEEFHTKIVRGALQGRRSVGFLWSKGPGGDTGYGKTALMKSTVKAINADWGTSIQRATKMKENRIVPVVAGFSEFNTMTRTGMYPVLFNAVTHLAVGDDSPLVRAHQRVCEAIQSDSPDKVRALLHQTRMRIAPTSSALRPDVTDAFCAAPSELAEFLGGVSDAAQVRNGIQYLNFAFIALAAGGVKKLFLMINQLEDLATNKALSAAKRRREIGRIRDLLETEPYGSMLHMTFTFHATAARELESFWEANRLPSYEDTPSNQAAVVVLRGLRDDEQVAALLRTWMEPHRNENAGEDNLVPFERSALSVLRRVSQGRPGILLNRANEVFDAGAQSQVGRIDDTFARNYFAGAGISSEAGEDDKEDARDVLDLLA